MACPHRAVKRKSYQSPGAHSLGSIHQGLWNWGAVVERRRYTVEEGEEQEED